jgi:hypothetical protein
MKAKMADVTATWTKATEAFNAGDIKGALENGSAVKASVDWMESVWEAVAPAAKK